MCESEEVDELEKESKANDILVESVERKSFSPFTLLASFWCVSAHLSLFQDGFIPLFLSCYSYQQMFLF